MANLTTAITSLGFALLEASLKALPAGDSGTGVFFSPVSVYYALTLALNGAGTIGEAKQPRGATTQGAPLAPGSMMRMW